ncbi:MAG: hypothetical protein ACI9FR_001825 [Cryomorphaceae bacterium]|jgi:hypothetical protein
MVIYDLICDAGHEFEGWFRNVDDLVSQQGAGILCCPYCDTKMVSKKLTAPKLGLKSNSTKALVPQQETQASTSTAVSGGGSPQAYNKLQRMLGEVHKFIETNFEDVGNRFTDEAISMHRGEKDAGNIRGTASAKQLKELEQEGVMAVPLPEKPIDKKKLN